ncbi:hypothetical protein ARC20_03080 [Stenotrophomonas panacihumi]|uniref:Uncharacterized protein n=1 Tax=Stenotrophomonas panacihumi TaxID=676599 RepID=A0A0R0AQ21_9GAMM|nr:hypothetical protein ARC20_03080 [Stenotrophomonas panacihumi]PTN55804.1 hypothetical protein C9J98_04320 [Stenotrophomonas panacihumi]
MDRATATALIDQLCRDLPAGGTSEADEFDYGWFRERVGSVAEHCRAADGIYIWQYALWHLDQAGLMPEGIAPLHWT